MATAGAILVEARAMVIVCREHAATFHDRAQTAD